MMIREKDAAEIIRRIKGGEDVVEGDGGKMFSAAQVNIGSGFGNDIQDWFIFRVFGKNSETGEAIKAGAMGLCVAIIREKRRDGKSEIIIERIEKARRKWDGTIVLGESD
jgi:hypothetical protein